MNPTNSHSAVILDMDGTLLDLHFDDQVWNYALPARLAARSGLPLAETTRQVADTIAGARGTLRWYCLEHWSEVFGLPVHAVEVELAHLIRVRPGTLAFLEHLTRQGIPAILATNAHPSSLTLKLARTGIGAHFGVLCSSHDIGAPKEEQAFWHALQQQTGFEPAQSMLVDDNLAVLEAARRFGVRDTVGVLRPSSSGQTRHYGEFEAVDTLDELIDRCHTLWVPPQR